MLSFHLAQSHSEIGKCHNDTVMLDFWLEQCDCKMKALSALCKVQLQIASQQAGNETAVRRLSTEHKRAPSTDP
jgi:hypothetical protein